MSKGGGGKYGGTTRYGRSFSLLVVLFILLIIIGTAYNRPYGGYSGGYGYC